MTDQTFATFSDLTDGTVETRDVPLPGGKVVRVRGLTRYELMVNAKGTEDSTLIERRNVTTCLIEPRLTEKQVEKWQKSPGSVQALAAVTVAIRDLSGLGQGAGKSDLPGDGDD